MDLLGKGLLALTVDQRGDGGELQQGIVELGGDSLSDCMLNYFHRSEQVRTGIRVAVARDPMSGRWHAGAIVMQALPVADPRRLPEAEEDWRRAMLLLGTASDEELLDPSLRPDDLLFRLFHEDGVRVFDALAARTRAAAATSSGSGTCWRASRWTIWKACGRRTAGSPSPASSAAGSTPSTRTG